MNITIVERVENLLIYFSDKNVFNHVSVTGINWHGSQTMNFKFILKNLKLLFEDFDTLHN